LDSSPLLPVSDAVPLLGVVDGVLIVCRMGTTTRHAVKQLKEILSRVPNANVLGVIANDVKLQQASGYGGYGLGPA
jgi:Mrp family chromosome partitioning ATPase